MRTLITNGTDRHRRRLATPADVLSTARRSPRSARDLAAAASRPTRRSTRPGRYVIPGGIDVHTHMELPFGGTFAKDTFETGTRAAAFGGTTTIVDFAVQSQGQVAARGPRRLARQGRGQRRHRLRLPHDHERRQRRHAGRDGPARRRGRARLQAVHRLPGRLLQRRRRDLPGDAADRQERRADHDARRERPGHRRRRRRRRSRPARPTRICHGARPLPDLRGRGDEPGHPPGRGGRGARLHRPPLGARCARRRARRPATAARRPSPRRARSTCSSRSTTWATASRAPSSSARRRCATEGPPGRAVDGPRQGRPPGRLDRPLPVRLPRPEGARPGRLPQDPQRPARRRGPASTCSTTAASSAAGSRKERWVEIISTAPAKLFGMYPRKGADRGRLRRRPRHLRPEPPHTHLGARPTTWTSTTRATRAATVQGGRTSCCRAARSSSATAQFTGPQGRRPVHQARARRLRPDGLTDGLTWPRDRDALDADLAPRSPTSGRSCATSRLSS